MASTAPTSLGRRLRLAVAGAVCSPRSARPPPPWCPRCRPQLRPRPDLTLTPPARPPSAPAWATAPARAPPFPGFLLDRGRYTSFEAPDPDVQLIPLGINNAG
jgi:hypothetical protein